MTANQSEIIQLPDQIELPILFKISKEKYLKDIQRGKLYMNNLKYFVDLEKRTGTRGQGDVREASFLNVKRHELFIQVAGQERQKVDIGPAPGIIYNEEALYHPVFCMVCEIYIMDRIEGTTTYSCKVKLDSETIESFVDEEHIDEYKALAVVYPQPFLEKLYDATYKLRIAGRHGLIRYRDMSLFNIVNGKWFLDDTFTKDNFFRKQHEFRIELFYHSEEPFILDIGDISQETFMIDIDVLKKGITVQQTLMPEQQLDTFDDGGKA